EEVSLHQLVVDRGDRLHPSELDARVDELPIGELAHGERGEIGVPVTLVAFGGERLEVGSRVFDRGGHDLWCSLGVLTRNQVKTSSAALAAGAGRGSAPLGPASSGSRSSSSESSASASSSLTMSSPPN